MFRVVFSFLLFLFPVSAMAAEEPRYTRVEQVGDIEIRDYAPQIVAEVIVSGDRRQASGRGFRPLANYIFGGNQPRADIAMTAPVTSTRSGEEIAMTAPVTREPTSDGRWTVAFIMPSEWTMETLPVPNDSNVRLREQPGRRIVAVRFSGSMGQRSVARHLEELTRFMQAREMSPLGAPTYASYDPPWIPAPFRRNEIWVEISAD